MRVPWLLLTAGAAGLSVVTNGVASAVALGQSAVPDTRLGTQIDDELRVSARKDAERRRALDLREQALKAAQLRAAQQAEVAKPPAAPAVPTPDERYTDLARIFQSMKPAKAAPVFEKLSAEVQFEVAQRMRDRNAALIMQAMSAEGAAKLGMALAKGDADGKAPKSAPSAARASTPALTGARPAAPPR